jgi:hypothetical protein
MKLRFFIVMPFGKKEVKAATLDEAGNLKAPAKEADFDLIYEKLIRPALLEGGYEPFRADDEAGAGDIRTDMFFELVTADFVLADISILNPNVLSWGFGMASRRARLRRRGSWNKRRLTWRQIESLSSMARSSNTDPTDAAWEERVRQEMHDLAAPAQCRCLR